MVSKSLSLAMLIVVALLGDRTAQGAPAAREEDACTKEAFEAYDYRTKNGCGRSKSESDCKFLFEASIKILNDVLETCGNMGGYSLCRVKNPGFFSFGRCSATLQLEAATKEACEAASKEPYTFIGQDGYRNTYSASEAYCINSPNYNCISEC
ncbi:hypothetical protein BD408DRAFT_408323 [Parasitella parasitica]|nr:hypothetical protein BD408DRAFT_408323 [Parasitella parasitica]